MKMAIAALFAVAFAGSALAGIPPEKCRAAAGPLQKAAQIVGDNAHMIAGMPLQDVRPIASQAEIEKLNEIDKRRSEFVRSAKSLREALDQFSFDMVECGSKAQPSP